MERTAQAWGDEVRTSFGGSSGNRAFDEYREATLRRLEEEQREFREFLDNLRHAKDRAEFDQFMAGRKNRDSGTGAGDGGNPQAA
jgi:hypothetical protein